MIGPVISQPRHRIHPSKLDCRRLVIAQLLSRRGKPLVERPDVLLRQRLVELLALFRDRRFQLLTLRFEREACVPAGSVDAVDLRLR